MVVPPPCLKLAGGAAALPDCAALAPRAERARPTGQWRESLRRDPEGLEHTLVVAESGQEIVGYGRARLFERPEDAPADTVPHGFYLTGVFVLPGQRQRGLVFEGGEGILFRLAL